MMSSKQIAKFLSEAEGREVRHDNVKRTMDRLESRELVACTPMEDVRTGGNNREYLETIYYVDHDAAVLVVAQMCPEVTAALVQDYINRLLSLWSYSCIIDWVSLKLRI